MTDCMLCTLHACVQVQTQTVALPEGSTSPTWNEVFCFTRVRAGASAPYQKLMHHTIIYTFDIFSFNMGEGIAWR